MGRKLRDYRRTIGGGTFLDPILVRFGLLSQSHSESLEHSSVQRQNWSGPLFLFQYQSVATKPMKTACQRPPIHNHNEIFHEKNEKNPSTPSILGLQNITKLMVFGCFHRLYRAPGAGRAWRVAAATWRSACVGAMCSAPPAGNGTAAQADVGFLVPKGTPKIHPKTIQKPLKNL